MPAIPIDVDDEEAVDPEEVRRQPPRAIPLPATNAAPISIATGARRAIGGAADNPEEIPSGVIGSTPRQVIPIGAAPRPQVMSSGGIPTTPQTPRGIIPTNPATGEAEQVNNKGIPIKAGIAGLWAKADNIHNPVLRVLGKIGTGALKAIDYAGEAALPGVESRIPGSEGNERAQENRKLAVDKEQAETAAKTAQTAHTNAETDALQAKPDQPTDKPIHSYVNAEGKQVTIFQKADNSTYEKTFGDVNQKDPAAKTVNTKEDIVRRIHEAYEAGDPATVKKLQGELKAIGDPYAQTKIEITQQGVDQRAANATRQDVREHDKAYVQPAETVEKSYQMMDHAYQEYEAARKAGKELPTGAESMVALSTHLSTTFGNVKGARVTKDMIHEHLGARSISDDMLVAVQKFTNGDQLSPEQWKAFHDLISESRKLTWDTATKQAKRKGIPVDFLPDDLAGGGGSAAPPAGAKVRDYTNVGTK